MSAVEQTRLDIDDKSVGISVLGELIRARIACDGGSTRTEILRDLSQFVSHKLSPARWRETADAQLLALSACDQVIAKRNRYHATTEGLAAAKAWIGSKSKKQPDWPTLRDSDLVAKALGLETESAPKRKALATPDGLRAIILQKTHGLALRPNLTARQVRAQLALVALERAFGNKIKTGLGAGKDFSAKAGRLLAAQLSERPREYPTDSKLVAALAAEAVDSRQTDADSLRQALLRALVTAQLSPPADSGSPSQTQQPRAPANDTAPATSSKPPVARPDPAGFAAEVQVAAGQCAEGWPGNRKAYISRVWQAIRVTRPEWGLSEIEFKCMLAEAHRAGHLALATADLKNKSSMSDIEASAIGYMNTVWHLVRVED